MALSGGGSQLPMPAIVTRYTDLLPFALVRPQEPFMNIMHPASKLSKFFYERLCPLHPDLQRSYLY